MARLISHKQTRMMVAEMARAAQGGPKTWDPWNDANNKPATVYFACGELMNDAIRGFVWAWHMKNRIVIVPTEEQKRISGLNAHGLEGLIKIDTDLCVCLMVYRDLPPYRARVAI